MACASNNHTVSGFTAVDFEPTPLTYLRESRVSVFAWKFRDEIPCIRAFRKTEKRFLERDAQPRLVTLGGSLGNHRGDKVALTLRGCYRLGHLCNPPSLFSVCPGLWHTTAPRDHGDFALSGLYAL
jgi:hypothetical protein